MVSSISLNGRIRVQFNKISGLIDPCRSRFVSLVFISVAEQAGAPNG